MFLQSRRYIWMRVGRDIWIDPKSNLGGALEPRGASSKGFQFRSAFNIEQKNAGLQGRRQVRSGVARTGENDLLYRTWRCTQTPFQFAARDNIKPASQFCKKP